MSLLCRLGRHKPRGIPRWNDGLYFAACERCGRDLVRTAYQGWHVPKGYKVVWSDRPPASRPGVALVPEEKGSAAASGTIRSPETPVPGPDSAPADAAAPREAASGHAGASEATSPATAPAPDLPAEPAGDSPSAATPVFAGGSKRGRLPIEDVLAHLNAEESANRALQYPPQVETPASSSGASSARQTAPAPEEPLARQRRSTWDFMDDDPIEDSAPAPEPAPTPGGASGAEVVLPVEREVEPASRKAGGAPEQWRRIRSALRNFFSGPAEPRPLLVTGLALALAVAVALALYSAGYPAPEPQPGSPEESAAPGGEGDESGSKPDPFAASSPHLSPEGGTAEPQQGVNGPAREEVAYVAASLLICRDAPADGARRVRNLLRGREVRVLGYDGAWASLDYRGGQCWAQAQYLSPVPPV
ncbi:MAG TPA: hypothetical protein VE891_06380 [Allosphingosinicella sp.]|nr:hypothetical protein [Allosphingosinicella sp.]